MTESPLIHLHDKQISVVGDACAESSLVIKGLKIFFSEMNGYQDSSERSPKGKDPQKKEISDF